MSKFKVEIEKILERGVCPFGFKAGDIFVYEDKGVPETFPNFCAWAFHELPAREGNARCSTFGAE